MCRQREGTVMATNHVEHIDTKLQLHHHLLAIARTPIFHCILIALPAHGHAIAIAMPHTLPPQYPYMSIALPFCAVPWRCLCSLP